jgi:hypothetical protein
MNGIQFPRSILLALMAGAALLTAGCTGNGAGTPPVASLPSTSSAAGAGTPATAGSAAAGSKANATQLVDEWAACMRGHGDPNQADPVINSGGDIEITMMNVSQAMSQEAHDSTGPCGSYLVQAANVLRNGQPAPQGPSFAQELKYAQCMRASGVPKYPDPVPGSTETDLNGIGMSLDSPVFVNADKLCTRQAGIQALPASIPGIVQVVSCNGVPSCKPPSQGELPPAHG